MQLITKTLRLTVAVINRTLLTYIQINRTRYIYVVHFGMQMSLVQIRAQEQLCMS